MSSHGLPRGAAARRHRICRLRHPLGARVTHVDDGVGVRGAPRGQKRPNVRSMRGEGARRGHPNCGWHNKSTALARLRRSPLAGAWEPSPLIVRCVLLCAPLRRS